MHATPGAMKSFRSSDERIALILADADIASDDQMEMLDSESCQICLGPLFHII